MPLCCSTFSDIADKHFDSRIAQRDLAEYRENGAGSTTRLLRDLLVETRGLQGVLLDVGSGIGALTFELLDRGVSSAIDVDASSAHLAAAFEESVRRGKSGAVRLVHGDFLDLASQFPEATVVTLDRVVCCYPLYERLLEQALRLARHYFAYSYPRDLWYVHWAIGFENGVRRLRRNPFRAFVHPAVRMTEMILDAGFTLSSHRQTRIWSVDVYKRR